MSEKDTRNPPFGLDMPFGEALERFIGTDRQEALRAEGIEAPSERRKESGLLTWHKKLSQTDAQQETTGGLVPYLRLTKASLEGEDFQTWFRQEFFGNAAWVAGSFGKEPVELAKVPFEVSVGGINLGTQTVEVSHGENRKDKHNTPNTWIHWNSQLSAMLQLNNFTDHTVTLTREDTGVIRMDIAP